MALVYVGEVATCRTGVFIGRIIDNIYEWRKVDSYIYGSDYFNNYYLYDDSLSNIL